MTLQWIPLDALVPHPENSNRMPPKLLAKLKANIQRTGLYEPLVVRPIASSVAEAERPASGAAKCDLQYQILNGHHRARVLGELGHTHARCDVWEVDDREARILLATLNRLEGRDDPSARAALVAHLAEDRTPEALAELLPEPPDAVERLLRLAAPPPAPLNPGDLPDLPRPMTFFLTEEQHAVVAEALREAGEDRASLAAPLAGRVCETPNNNTRPARSLGPFRASGAANTRADRLERLALWYLEARNLR